MNTGSKNSLFHRIANITNAAIVIMMVSFIFGIIALPSDSYAFRSRERRIPNGQLDSLNSGGCGSTVNMCHVAAAGAGQRTAFGDAFCYGSDSTRDTSTCLSLWNLYMSMLDSDGDGYSNGEELGDSLGVYDNNVGTNPQPAGPYAWVPSNPADSTSHPAYPSSIKYTTTPYAAGILWESCYDDMVRIAIRLEGPTITSLNVYDLQGHKVAGFSPTMLGQGTMIWRWATKSVASGPYFVIMTTPSIRKSIPVVITH